MNDRIWYWLFDHLGLTGTLILGFAVMIGFAIAIGELCR